MSIDLALNLITNSVRRSGTQLDAYRSGDARSSERSLERAAFWAINISPLTGVKTRALCIFDKLFANCRLFLQQTASQAEKLF